MIWIKTILLLGKFLPFVVSDNQRYPRHPPTGTSAFGFPPPPIPILLVLLHPVADPVDRARQYRRGLHLEARAHRRLRPEGRDGAVEGRDDGGVTPFDYRGLVGRSLGEDPGRRGGRDQEEEEAAEEDYGRNHR